MTVNNNEKIIKKENIRQSDYDFRTNYNLCSSIICSVMHLFPGGLFAGFLKLKTEKKIII